MILSSWDKLLLSSTLKDLLVSVWKQIRLTEQRAPVCTPLQWVVYLLEGGAQSWLNVRSLWTLFPLPLPRTLLHLHLSTLPPPYRGAGAPERRGEGSRGQSLFLFGSRGLLGEAWRENGCIRARVGGQDFNSVKEQLVWVSLHVALPSLSPQIQGDEKFVQRGTSKIKKVYGPKPLPLPCSSIREECNNVSIWPQLDWLKTRKFFLCFGVLTTGWNLIKKLKKLDGTFHTWDERNSLPQVSISMRNYYFSHNFKQVRQTVLAVMWPIKNLELSREIRRETTS